ncbi:MAG: hypothetical protein BWY98_00428 [Tenericutes bacterium ADurb.BinA155]|nr:MAG: hypothetical protein BWY98_00428 [Tenericutes bacterium ADurb.BinA155]
MENASKVMYKIANIFNWIAAVFGIVIIVFSILGGLKVDLGSNFTNNLGWNTLWEGIWWLVWAVVLIVLTRIAYNKGSSKGWDVLFLVFGILGWNVFYILGGIFGLVAHKD